MDARPSHIRDEHDFAVQIREQSIEELQDVVSRNLSFLTKGHIATSETHTTLKTRCRMRSCLPTSIWISSEGLQR
jgi:hypothetical protein